MPQTYKLDYIEFPSQSAAASRRFIEQAFGWGFTNYGPTYEAINNAGIGAGFQADPASRTAAPLAVIRTEDLDLAEREVVAAGGVITTPAFDFPGGRRFHFREPGGNELAVYIEIL